LRFGKRASILQSSSIEQFNETVAREQMPNINEKSADFSKKELGKLVKKLISQVPKKRVVTMAGWSW
jgi:hypothetical protein